VIAAILLGTCFGAAVIIAGRALFPAAPPLSAALARLSRSRELTTGLPAVTEPRSDYSTEIGRRVGTAVGRIMASLGLAPRALDADLRLVGRTIDQHLGQKALLAVFGLLLPSLTAFVAAAGGVQTGFVLPIGLGVAAAVVFFFVPDLTLRSEAAKRRSGFRHGLGSFLDLVVISLAGGAGVESALKDSAEIGRGWAFAQLRDAIQMTALTGESPWMALSRLGADLGVPELNELASSVSLAGTEGARVRESLAAKATSLRDHELAAAESEAQSATERMALPVVTLFLGFLILIGYPAVDAVLTGL
jgi:Flp pilus assembly protein TadB